MKPYDLTAPDRQVTSWSWVDGERMGEAILRPRPTLYPPIEPYDYGFLDVDGVHRIYWEACGNPNGKPALFLHGGPGGGCSASNRRFFNPQRYRIILFDQRGCGRSLPYASLEGNTTWHLVSDMEKLRSMLKIERWLLFGGSWGATLALAYAQAYPQYVSEMVLRGVFTARQAELRWLYQEGASFLFPDAWERFITPIPEHEHGTLIEAYYRRLTSGDSKTQAAAASAWCAWEDRLTALHLAPDAHAAAASVNLALAIIEAHYFLHNAFLTEGQLIGHAHRLNGIPAAIVQGRYDVVTPMMTAWELCKAWQTAKLHIVPHAGHASSEPGTLPLLIAATDQFAEKREKI